MNFGRESNVKKQLAGDAVSMLEEKMNENDRQKIYRTMKET